MHRDGQLVRDVRLAALQPGGPAPEQVRLDEDPLPRSLREQLVRSYCAQAGLEVSG